MGAKRRPECRAAKIKRRARSFSLAFTLVSHGQSVSQAILNRSTLSSRLLALGASSQSIGVVPSCYAAQHRVATDTPGGAFKIRPILVKVCAIYPAPRLQGARLNARRWAAVAWEQVFVWVRFASLRVCSARRAVILGEPLRA